MKKFLCLLFLICPVILSAQETKLYEPLNYQKAIENGTRSRDGKPGTSYWQNHADYNIHVKLDTLEKSIQGEQDIVYYNNSPDTLRQIVLRLYQNKYKKEAVRNMEVHPTNIHNGLELDTLVINQKGMTINDSLTATRGTNLAVKLDDPLPPGQQLTIYCKWSSRLPVAPDFRRMGYYKDDAWFIGYFYPQIAVYDDMEYFFGQKGWDYMLYHKGMQEFYNGFNNYRVTIDVPENFYVWATGELVNAEEIYTETLFKRVQEAKSSNETVHIITSDDQPNELLKGNQWIFEAKDVPDFGFGTAPEYLWDGTSVEVDGRRIFVDVAYHPESELYDRVIDIARESVLYASTKFPGIPYPYDRSTTFNGMLGGGMEFPMIANNADTPDTTFLYALTFHEIFHNYCPFMMGFNEKRYPFMDEGFTALFTDQYMEDTYGLDQYADRDRFGDVGNVMKVYEHYAETDDFPIINAYAGLADHNLFYQYYVKPAVAYELFMEMIGKEDFNRGFREFVDRWEGKHPTPWDLFYTFNDVLDENYNWFWKAWFFDLGYPDLGLEMAGDQLVVKRVGALPLPVNISIEYSDGHTQQIQRSMKIWKQGGKEISLALDDVEKISHIRLNTRNIPDLDYSNNDLKTK